MLHQTCVVTAITYISTYFAFYYIRADRDVSFIFHVPYFHVNNSMLAGNMAPGASKSLPRNFGGITANRATSVPDVFKISQQPSSATATDEQAGEVGV